MDEPVSEDWEFLPGMGSYLEFLLGIDNIADCGGEVWVHVIFPSPFSIFPPTLCFHFYSYLFRGAFCDFLGSGQQFLFSDSCMTWRPGRSPEKWHVNNTVAPCQVQWNLSLRISQGPGHVFLWHAEMLSNALMSLVHRWAGILHPRC